MRRTFPPRQLISAQINRAVTLAAGTSGIVWLIVGGILLIDVLVSKDRLDIAVIPLICLAVQAALLVWVLVRPSTSGAVAYFLISTLCVFFFQQTVLDAFPEANADARTMLDRGAYVLTRFGAVSGGPLTGVLWSIAGFALGSGATAAAQTSLGLPVLIGEGPIAAVIVFCGVLLALRLGTRSYHRRAPDTDLLAAETARATDERRVEQRAAALIHDTVLGDLAALSTRDGPLSDHERARFSEDARSLAGLLASGGVPEQALPSLHGDLRALADEVRSLGLTVAVSGNEEGLAALDPDARFAMLGAVRAGLQNVHQHSGEQRAEVFIDRDANQVTVMVVDHGAGFSTKSVGADRLGVRNSIIGRLISAGGNATVWSQPGIGTSVLLSMPLRMVEAEREI
jgi:signal transduction histidine kinase